MTTPNAPLRSLRRPLTLPVALALALSTGGCSAVSTASPATTVAAGPTATAAGLDCLAVPSSALAQIATGAEPGLVLNPRRGAAVRDEKGVYVIAMEFDGVGAGASVGVWTGISLEGNIAPLLVADITASAATTWSSVEEFPQYGVPLDSPLIPRAQQCLTRVAAPTPEG